MFSYLNSLLFEITCISRGDMNLFKTEHVAFRMLHFFSLVPAAPFMVHCNVSLLSLISQHQLLHVFPPCPEINQILTSCFTHVFSASAFLEGCVSTENFQLVKECLHEVSVCEQYQLIISMIGLHYTEVRVF
jgi:hypothetical protein